MGMWEKGGKNRGPALSWRNKERLTGYEDLFAIGEGGGSTKN